MKRSIAIITHDCNYGGSVGSVAWHQAIELSKYYNVYVITKNIPIVNQEYIYPILIKPRKWDFLKRFCHVPNDLSFQLSARRALVELCNSKKISAVWCHSHASSVITSFLVSKKYKYKVIMTTHGDIYDRPAGTYDKAMTIYYKLVTKKAYQFSDHIHVLSPYMARLAEKHGVSVEKISVIPNGIEPADIGAKEISSRTKESFIPNGILRILYVGGLLKIKGVDHLIRALAIVRSKSQLFSLICIGEGPELRNLKLLCESYGLSGSVKFLGKVDRSSLHRYYMNSDVLCVPSNNDPLPTVILEAFSCGLPALGSRTGGITTMIDRGQGWLFKLSDEIDLANSILDISQDRKKLEDVSYNCSYVATNKYSWNAIGMDLKSIVDNMFHTQ